MNYLTVDIAPKDFALAALVIASGVAAGIVIAFPLFLLAPVLAAALLATAVQSARQLEAERTAGIGKEAITEKISATREQLRDLELQSDAIDEVEKLLGR